MPVSVGQRHTAGETGPRLMQSDDAETGATCHRLVMKIRGTKIRGTVVRRVVPVVVGVGAILAGSTGLAQADNWIFPAPTTDKVSAPGPCAWSTHWQTGQCVDVETPVIPTTPGIDESFPCPAEYPFPFEGAFSGNPTWLDRSYEAAARVAAVADNGLPNQRDYEGGRLLSYAGGYNADGTIRPGYVTVRVSKNEIFGKPEDSFVQGRYQCADTLANPR